MPGSVTGLEEASSVIHDRWTSAVHKVSRLWPGRRRSWQVRMGYPAWRTSGVHQHNRVCASTRAPTGHGWQAYVQGVHELSQPFSRHPKAATHLTEPIAAEYFLIFSVTCSHTAYMRSSVVKEPKSFCRLPELSKSASRLPLCGICLNTDM